MSTEVDHLVVTADTLDEGSAWCRAVLGVEPMVGGRHALMGTHNRLVNLSTSRYPQCYLEIIAIDPDAPSPARRRWFDLDDRRPGPPRLVQVVARSKILDMHRWGLIHQGVDPGPLVALSRGSLHWKMLLRADAAMRPGLPMLIQWDAGHPTDSLPASGAALESLMLDGLAPRCARVLGLRHVQGAADAPPGLKAVIRTPLGCVELSDAA